MMNSEERTQISIVSVPRLARLILDEDQVLHLHLGPILINDTRRQYTKFCLQGFGTTCCFMTRYCAMVKIMPITPSRPKTMAIISLEEAEGLLVCIFRLF
jgi:hypothetical protein